MHTRQLCIQASTNENSHSILCSDKAEALEENEDEKRREGKMPWQKSGLISPHRRCSKVLHISEALKACTADELAGSPALQKGGDVAELMESRRWAAQQGMPNLVWWRVFPWKNPESDTILDVGKYALCYTWELWLRPHWGAIGATWRGLYPEPIGAISMIVPRGSMTLTSLH